MCSITHRKHGFRNGAAVNWREACFLLLLGGSGTRVQLKSLLQRPWLSCLVAQGCPRAPVLMSCSVDWLFEGSFFFFFPAVGWYYSGAR